MTHRVISDYTRVDNQASNIKVYVRARPLAEESDQADFLILDSSNDKKIVVKDPEASNRRYGEVSFQFDDIFWTKTSQEEVFGSTCRSQVDHVLNGYNSCCFACKLCTLCIIQSISLICTTHRWSDRIWQNVYNVRRKR